MSSREVFLITDLPERDDDPETFVHDLQGGGCIAVLLFAAITAAAMVMLLLAPPFPVRIVAAALAVLFGTLTVFAITRRGGTR